MAIGILTLLALGALPPAGTYAVDPSRTVLMVQLRPDESRLLSGLSHRHVLRATKPEGMVRFDPARPDACRVQVKARVRDFEVDAPETRRRVGYVEMLDADDREDVAENMRDEDQLHARKYPFVAFLGDKCEVLANGRVRVTGGLTVRGVAKPLQLEMDVVYERGVLRAHVEFVLEHADFGFKPYSAGLGTLANDDWLKFTVEVVARRQAPPRPVETSTSAGAQ